MGDVKVRYYVTRQHPGRPKWGYWEPCLKRRNPKNGKIEPTLMAKLGFKHVNCGLDGPAAWATAESWNTKWDAALKIHRAGGSQANPKMPEAERIFPPNSLGEGFARYRKTNEWRVVKKPRTQEDWWRAWKHIEPIFGDVDPRTVTFEDIDLWYGGDPDDETIKGILQTLGVRESHRVIKIWRAMWRVVGRIKRGDGKFYCERLADPSLGIQRKNPKPRDAIWFEGEAVRLVKGAWREGYRGLSVALAVAWDTMLSPVDVRGCTLSQLANAEWDGREKRLVLDKADQGPYFDLDRTKTGKGAIGTLGRRATRLLEAYLASLPFELHPNTPIFHTRGGQPGPKGGKPRPPVPYTSDTLGDDFREIRTLIMPGDTRKVMDFRRSGSIEALAGDVTMGALAGKMANTIDSNTHLQKSYLPYQASVVRLADEARSRGRVKMRNERKPTP